MLTSILLVVRPSLVHSINAAASAYELRPLFEHYRGQRPVYAPDLLGFGFSERSDRATLLSCTPPHSAISSSISPLGGRLPTSWHSLGSEFAARAALQQPERVHSLTLISPTGLTGRAHRNRSERAGTRAPGAVLYQLFRFPLWSQAFYDILASRLSIRYSLQRSFVGAPDRGWSPTPMPLPTDLVPVSHRRLS